MVEVEKKYSVQGDQMGRIFAQWAKVKFGKFFKNISAVA
jgi:hypothetical protein